MKARTSCACTNKQFQAPAPVTLKALVDKFSPLASPAHIAFNISTLERTQYCK